MSTTREQVRQQHYHEAVGWALSMLDGHQLAAGAHQAIRAGCPEVARHLLRWADQRVETPLFVDWADRKRERTNVRGLLISLVPDDEDL